MTPSRRGACIALGLAAFVAAGAAAQTIAITGGTVHPVAGPPIENGVVLMEDGRIVAVGPAAEVSIGDAAIVDATGKVVTPGLIEAGTQLGLVEVGAVASTRHGSLDRGANRSAFRVSDGLDPRSMLFAIARADGVTGAITSPTGGVLSGQGAALTTLGATRAEVLFRDPVALYASLGPGPGAAAGGSRAGAVMELREALEDARDEVDDVEEDAGEPGQAAVAAVLAGEIPLIVRASGATDIEMALEIQAEYGFRMVIDGGEEAWLLAERLAAAGVPVMVRALANLPTQFDRLSTRSPNPGLLSAAGVDVILTTQSSHRVGQVTHEAGNAVRYGMDWDDALEAITLAPARAFGIDDAVGSLEPGKRANVVIWSDDPLDFAGYAETVFIDGRQVDTTSRQLQLFERYRRIDP
ncbi:amidohydrolase family protein [Candidatus Palauibacter sp.]|uniref:amidohydrolase family protein n=1 Tax=Candidatus Palauibacter sp. TaxID=3101350 RepID=UPI003B5AB552